MRIRGFMTAGVALLALLAAGCFVPHAQMVRDAQDAFSRGAELDNQRKFGLTPDDGSGHYEAALGLVNQALREAPDDLVADDLYGTALTLKALCLWRTGQPAEAVSTAEKIVAGRDGGREFEALPRDRALAAALDPLVKIDALGVLVRKFTSATTSAEVQREVMARLDGIESGLDAAAKDLRDGHPLRAWLATVRLELAYVVYTALTEQAPGARDSDHIARYVALRKAGLDALKAEIDDFDHRDPDGRDALKALKIEYEVLLDDVVAAP